MWYILVLDVSTEFCLVKVNINKPELPDGAQCAVHLKTWDISNISSSQTYSIWLCISYQIIEKIIFIKNFISIIFVLNRAIKITLLGHRSKFTLLALATRLKLIAQNRCFKLCKHWLITQMSDIYSTSNLKKKHLLNFLILNYNISLSDFRFSFRTFLSDDEMSFCPPAGLRRFCKCKRDK